MKGPNMEYFVNMITNVPEGTPDQAVDQVRAREAVHSRELAAQGHLRRLWRPPLQTMTAARGGAGLDAAAGVANRRGDAAVAAP
jgi:Muconolactone delta-isomerase